VGFHKTEYAVILKKVAKVAKSCKKVANFTGTDYTGNIPCILNGFHGGIFL
jgi:hypothetical protein